MGATLFTAAVNLKLIRQCPILELSASEVVRTLRYFITTARRRRRARVGAGQVGSPAFQHRRLRH